MCGNAKSLSLLPLFASLSAKTLAIALSLARARLAFFANVGRKNVSFFSSRLCNNFGRARRRCRLVFVAVKGLCVVRVPSFANALGRTFFSPTQRFCSAPSLSSAACCNCDDGFDGSDYDDDDGDGDVRDRCNNS